MKTVIALSLLCICSGTQLIPVPPRSDGYFMGPSRTNYTVDVFVDHLSKKCPDAWTAIHDYWKANSAWLELVVHQYPSSNNTYAFLVAQAGRYIQLEMPDKFTDFLDYIFEKQDRYLDGATYMVLNTIKNNLATDTQTATGAPYGSVLNALNDDTYNYDLRISWKYACSRQLTTTPSFLINGVWVPMATEFTTVTQWQDYFNSLQ